MIIHPSGKRKENVLFLWCEHLTDTDPYKMKIKCTKDEYKHRLQLSKLTLMVDYTEFTY